jgi:hypothetical protein
MRETSGANFGTTAHRRGERRGIRKISTLTLVFPDQIPTLIMAAIFIYKCVESSSSKVTYFSDANNIISILDEGTVTPLVKYYDIRKVKFRRILPDQVFF